MQKLKTKYSALGARRDCPNFYPCPLCYGCRNYDKHSIECEECSRENHKANICKKNLHKAETLAMMINNQRINTGGKI